MKKFEIRITDYDDNAELYTVDLYAEDFTSAQMIIDDALTTKVVAFYHGDNYILIEDYSEGGYYYARYQTKEAYENGEDDIDGGLCTSTLSNAIEMAITTVF